MILISYILVLGEGIYLCGELITEERISYEIACINKKYLDLYYTYEIYEERKKIKNVIKILKKYIYSGRIKELIYIGNRYLNRKRYRKNAEVSKLESQAFPANLRVAIFTCIIGGYDVIKEPIYFNRMCCDFFVITDSETSVKGIWKKIDIDSIKETRGLSSQAKARYIKTHPHMLFPEYDYSVWVDGSFRIVADIMPLIGAMEDAWFGVHRIASGIDCIYENAISEIGAKKAPKKDVKRQVEDYKKDGYPKHNGLFETGILIRKHNDATCISIMEHWWQQMDRYCMRDQMSINYVLWKNKVPKKDIYILGDNIYMNPRFYWQPHKKNIERKRNR